MQCSCKVTAASHGPTAQLRVSHDQPPALGGSSGAGAASSAPARQSLRRDGSPLGTGAGRRRGRLQRGLAGSLPQLGDPARDRPLFAGQLLVTLERRQRALGITQIEVRDHAEVPVGRRKLGSAAIAFSYEAAASGNSPRSRCVAPELVPGHRARAVALHRALQRLLGLIEAPRLAIQDSQIHVRRRQAAGTPVPSV